MRRRKQTKEATNVYSPAPEVRAIADSLIPEHHEHLRRYGVRIEYRFCAKPQKEKGRVTLGRARRITNLNAYLAGKPDRRTGELLEKPFFVITVFETAWKYGLSEKQRTALVDHELSHCWAEEDEETEEVKLSIRPHDVEEFNAVVRRHGRWLEDVDDIQKAAEAGPQLTPAQISRCEERRAAA